MKLCHPLRLTRIHHQKRWGGGRCDLGLQLTEFLYSHCSAFAFLVSGWHCRRLIIVAKKRFSVIQFETSYAYCVFVSAGVAVLSTFISVMAVNWLGLYNKASAEKASKMLLLHMVQLGLSLCSAVNCSNLFCVSKKCSRVVVGHIHAAVMLSFLNV